MRLRETGLSAAREVRDALRARWFVAAAASFLVMSLGLSMLGLAGAERSGLAGFDRTTASLLNLALVFVPLLTLALGGLGLSGEIEDGSLGMLLAQPITRSEAYLGKYLGLLAAIAAAIVTGFGATGVVVSVVAGGGNVRAFLGLVALTVLLAGATLGLGTLLSVALRGRAKVIGAAFSLWLVLVYVSDLGTIGLAIARHLEPVQIFILALLNPLHEARVLGVLALTDRVEVLGPVGIFGIECFGAGGLVFVLVAALVAWTALPLAAGHALFRKAPLT